MEHLSHHHRNTLQEIFDHQATGNVDWRKVHNLLGALNAIDEEHGDRLKVTLGPETEVLPIPKRKELDRQTVVDLRRMSAKPAMVPRGPGSRRPRSRLRRLALGRADLSDAQRSRPPAS